MALMTGDSLFWKTGISTAGLEKGAVKSKGIIAGLASSITKTDVFFGLGVSAALAFKKISKQVYDFSKDFEHAMREVMTISDATKQNFEGISDEIVEMSKTVPDNAIKLSKAFYQIVSSGKDGAEAMDILKVSANLAVASITDTEVAADAITYVMNSFSESAGDAENIAGKLFMTVKLGKVKMEELAPSVSKVAGMWAQAGGSFEDMMAAIATGVKSLPVDIMTTAIRGILAAIISPSEDAKKVINELGIEFDATTLATKGFSHILIEMKEAVGDDADKMEKLAAIFPNVRGLIGALALDSEKYTEALDSMSKGTEEFNEATKIMIADTTNQLAILKNTAMAKLKPLGDHILGFMNKVATGINEVMSGANDEFSKLAKTYSELADTLEKKKGRIDDLITTIENLRGKTELSKDEAIELNTAEEALILLLPDLGKAAKDAGEDFDILTEAKRGSLELSKDIMELELEQVRIEKERAALELKRFELEEGKSIKKVKQLEEKVKEAEEMVEDLIATSPKVHARAKKYIDKIPTIDELFLSISKYPLTDITKQIDEITQAYEKRGVTIENLEGRLLDIQKDQQMGLDTTIKQEELRNEILDETLEKNKRYQDALYDLSSAKLELGKKEIELRLNVEKTTAEFNIQTEALKKLEKIEIEIEVKAKVEDVKDTAETIADYLKPGSGTKKGPLRDLDKWGSRLIDTITEGMNKNKSIEKKVAEIHRIAMESIKISANDETTIAHIRNIEAEKIAEIEYYDWKQKKDESYYQNKKEMSNEELETSIINLEKFKEEYAASADAIIEIETEIENRKEEIWNRSIEQFNNTLQEYGENMERNNRKFIDIEKTRLEKAGLAESKYYDWIVKLSEATNTKILIDDYNLNQKKKELAKKEIGEHYITEQKKVNITKYYDKLLVNTRAEIEKKQAEIAWKKFELGKDKTSKEVKRLKEKVDTWYEEVSKKQTSHISELFRTMEMYPLDPYAKQIDALTKIYEGAGISVRNFGGRLNILWEDMKAGKPTIERQEKLIKEVTDALFARDVNLKKTRLDLSSAELKLGKAETLLRLEAEKTAEAYKIKTEAYEEFIEAISKPIITPKPESKYEMPPETKEPTIIPTLTDEQVKAVEDKLRYMASRHKKFLADVAEHDIEYVEEHNAQLAEDGENYAEYLDNMLEMYAENADLTKEIMEDIYEYNKIITAKRKEAEEEYFNYIAEAREKDLKKEKDKFKILIKKYKEGSNEYIKATKQHNQNIAEINEKYDKEIAEGKLAIFKANLEKQIGEEEKAYIERLKIASEEIGKKTKLNKEYFEFVNNKLQEISDMEEEIAKEKERILRSYLKSYQTTEEKIASIHAETIKLLGYTDDKYERERLKSIERQLIAAVKYNEARQELDKKDAEYGEKLNNKQLEGYIKFLEEMKIKYSKYTDIIILFNEKIAESQKQIWGNIRKEIDETVDAIHALARVVGNFDSELEEMINSMADLISGIGQITIGFSTGNIGGVISGIAVAISSIINLFVQHKSDVPELREELQAITLELQKQQNILSQSIGTAKTEAIQNTIDLLQEQIAVYNEMIEAEKEAYGQFLWWTWDETNQEAIEGWLAAIESANQAIANLNQQYQQILTGTTAETIADAIAEGFSQGLDSAQIFTDTFGDMMKKAIIDAFKRTIITRYIGHWYSVFSDMAADGLTPDEMDMLAEYYKELLGRIEGQWDTIQDVLDSIDVNFGDIADGVTDGADITGLTGAIAGITEETAGLLAGQFQAIRMNSVGMLNNLDQIIIINSKILETISGGEVNPFELAPKTNASDTLSDLNDIIVINSRIADNTEYNRYLENINSRIESIDNKTGTGLSGFLRAIGGGQ